MEKIRVIDLSMFVPGAVCGMLLGDFGADVIKVEEPTRGDPARNLQMYPEQNGIGVVFGGVNRNKRSIAVDLRSSNGRKILFDLCKNADVLIESYRPEVKRKLGIGYDKIRKINSRIVYCSISGYGQSGTHANMPGHDLNFDSCSGILSLTGGVGGHPSLPGFLIGDFSGALMGTVSVLAALMHSKKTGFGEWIDVSNTDCVVSLMNFAFGVGFATGHFPSYDQLLYNGMFACYNCYETKDKRYIAVTAIEEKFWRTFCGVLGRKDLEAEYLSLEKQKWLKSELDRIFRRKTMEQWIQSFLNVDACVSPVLRMEEVLSSEPIRSRGLVKEVVSRNGGRHKQIDNPIKFTVNNGEKTRLAPPLRGEHTREILGELGYSVQKISKLSLKGEIFIADDRE